MMNATKQKSAPEMMGKLLLMISMLLFATVLKAQNTYWWVGGTTGNYNAFTSWSTTKGVTQNTGNRTTTNAGDVLIIDGSNIGSGSAGSAVTINNLTNGETIASLIITRGSSFTATFGAVSATLNITKDLVLTSNCVLADGGNTFVVGGSFAASNTSTATVHSGAGNIKMAGTATSSSLGYITSSLSGTATSAYTGTTITVGTLWSTNTTYAVGQQVANAGYLYTITAQSGNSGTTAPSFVGGTQTIGNITYSFAGIAASISVSVSGTTPFQVSSISLSSGGSGYTSVPSITVNATGTGQTISVSGATLANAISLASAGTAQVSNIEIANGKNILLDCGGILQINGLLNLNTSGNLALNSKTLQFASSGTTSGTTGSISTGGGTLSAGNGPSSTTSGGYVSFTGTGNTATQIINFNTTSSNASSINNFTINRAGAIIKLGTCNANKLSMLSGTLILNNGTFDDGGNTIVISGGTIISNTSGTNNTVYQSSGGKIQASRTGTNVPLTAVTTGGTIKLANIEIISTNTSSYTIASGTTITGSLTFTGGSTINGTNLTVGDGTNDVAINVALGGFSTAPTTWASGMNLSYKGTSTAYTSNGNEIPSAANGKLKNVTINNTGGVTLASNMTIANGYSLNLVAGQLTNASFLTLANGSTIVRTAGTLSAAPIYGTTTADRVNVSIVASCTQGNESKGTIGKVGTLSVNGGTYTLSAALSVDSLNVTNATDILNAVGFALSGNTANTIGNAGIGSVQTQSAANPSLPLTTNGWANNVSYNAVSGSQYVTGGTYTNLYLGTASATTSLIAIGNLNVTGTLTTIAYTTTLDLGVNNITGIGAIANAGTIKTASVNNPSLPTGISWNGTISYNATTGTQYVSAGTYTNLFLGAASATTTLTALGDINVTGLLNTVAANTTFDLANNNLLGVASISNTGTIKTASLASNPLPNGLSWGGTISYYAAGNQNVVSGSYTNLSLGATATTSTQSALGNINISGALTTQATTTSFDLSTNNLVSVGTVANAGTIKTASVNNPALPTAQTWGGIVSYYAPSGTQYIAAGTYTNLNLGATSATTTLVALGNINITGTLTTVAATTTFDLGTNNLVGSGTLSNAGTIKTASVNNPSLPSSQTWGGNVSYYAPSGTQYVASGSYNNLSLGASSATTTLSALGNLTITGTLTTVASTTTLDLGTNNLTSIGTLANAGTIKTASTANPPIPSGISWNGTVLFNGTALQYLLAGTYNNLSISNSAASSSVALQGNVTITNQLNFSNSSVLTIAANTLTLQGTLTTNGTNGNIDATNNNAVVTYNGSAAQTIAANTFTNSNTVNNLTINNLNGVSLAANLNIGNSLNLTNGVLTSTGYNLTINNNATNAINGGSPTAYINGALTWTLPANNTASITYTFPVGSASSGSATYLPVNLINPLTGSGVVAATVTAFGSGNTTTFDGTLSGVSNEYWNFSTSGSFTSANIALTSGSVNNRSLIASRTATTYSSIGGLAASGVITSNSINSAQSLSIGSPLALTIGAVVPTTPSISGQSNGTGYYGQTLTINGTGFSSYISVLVNGASANVLSKSATQLTVVVPASATASGNIVLTDGSNVSSSFATIGYITTAAGDWSSPSVWLGGVVPPANATIFIAHPITVNTTNYDASVNTLTLLSNGSLTFGNTASITTNAIANAGAINMTSGGTVTLVGSTPVWTNTGSFVYGTGTIALNGTVSNTISGFNSFYNVNVGGNANLTGDTINGILQTNGSGAFTGTPVGSASLPSYGAGQTVNIYVSPTGSNVGPGNCLLLPVSLSRARTIAKSYTSNPCNILLEDGTYYQLTLDSTDTRISSAQIIYKAVNRGKAIFQPIKVLNRSNFQAIPDSVKNRIVNTAAKSHVMQMSLSGFSTSSVKTWSNVFADSNLVTPKFYLNTAPMMLARYPNSTTMTMDSVIFKGNNRPDTGGIFHYKDTRTKYWVQALKDEGLWLAGNWRVTWVLQYIKTKSIDTVNNIITQTDGVQLGLGNTFAGYSGNRAEPYFASNIFEEIDTVGEFSINFNNKMLYMWVPDTGTIQYSDSLTMPAISVTGVNNMQFQNLFFVGGLGNGIKLSGCNAVYIAGCDFTGCTDNAIMLSNANNCTIKSCDIHQVGSGGILMNSSTGVADLANLRVSNNKVINNHIYNYGQQKPLYQAAINLGNTIGDYVGFNKVHNSPHIGIAFGGGNSYSGGGNNNIFEYNEVDSTVMQYSDMGAFYGTGKWTDRGNHFRHNYIHDNLAGVGGNGLYLDNNTSGDTCTYNIVANSLNGLVNNGGYFNRFYNNVVINTARPVSSNSTPDTASAYISSFSALKSLYYTSPTYKAAYPNIADMVDTVKGKNMAFTSEIWSQYKGNAFFTFSNIYKAQLFTYVADNLTFNADGTTNNTYCQTGDPFVKWGAIFQNNRKVTNRLVNPMYPFRMDSLRTPGLLSLSGGSDWHINRIGLYADSFRTDVSATAVPGVSPNVTLSAISATNHIAPDTTSLVAIVTNPNIANCISSVQFFDNNIPLTGITVNRNVVSYDTVIYTASYPDSTLGNHNITFKVYDAPNWQYQSNAVSYSTDTSINWTGAYSVNWSTAANWSANRIPTDSDVVVIPSTGISNMPSITGATALAMRMTIKAGATLTINDTLQLNGDLFSNGTVNGAGTLRTKSTTTIPLPAAKTWSVTVQYNDTVNNQTIVSGNYGNLNIAGATRTLSPVGTINIAGSYTVTNAAMTTTGSTVNFNGTSNQDISGATSFNNLQLNLPSVANTLTLGGTTTVSGNLSLSVGRIVSTTSNTLTVTNPSTAAISGGDNNSYIDGPLTQAVVAGANSYVFPIGNYSSASKYMPDTISSVSNSENITVTAFNTNAGGTFNSSLTAISTSEYWKVQSSVADALTVTIVPPSLGVLNLIGTSTSPNGLYSTLGGYATNTSITASNIAFAANTPQYLLAATYPNPVITSVTSCLPGIASGTFYANDTLTITGNYFQTTSAVTVGGQPVTVLDATDLPTQLKVLVSPNAANGTVQVGVTSYAATYKSGYITRNNGSWNSGATWLGGVQPSGSAIVATVNNFVSLASSISNLYNITINSGDSLNASNIGMAFINNATFTNNGTYTGANSPSINGTMTNNGTMTFSSGSLTATGNLVVNGTTPISFKTITTSNNAILTFTTAPTITGNLYLNGSSTVTGNYPTYGSVSTLYYNTGTVATIGSEWKPNVSSGAGIPNAVQIGNGAAGSSITFASGNSYKTGYTFAVNSGYSVTIPSGVTLLPNNVKVAGAMTIANGATVQSAAAVIVSTTGTLNVGSATLSSNATLATGPSLSVLTGNFSDTGIVNNYGYIKMIATDLKVLSGGTLNAKANSVIDLAYNSPVVPTASWDAASSLYLTAILGGNPTNIAQAFGNIVWNSTGQTGNLSITGVNSIAGTFAIINTGSGSIRLNNTTNSFGALQVGGSYTINGSVVNATIANLNVGYTTAATTQVNGNITIGSNGILAANTAGNTINLTGNWSNSGTFTNTNTTVTFNGAASTQSITKSGGESFANLTVATSGSGNVALNNAVTVSGTLQLTGGNITLGNNNFTTTSLTGGAASTYIVTNGTGVFTKNNVASTAVIFPIGTATSYAPITITNTSGTSNLSVAVSPTITNAVASPTQMVNLQWSVNSSVSTTSTITYQFNTADGASAFVSGNSCDLGIYTSGYTSFNVGVPSPVSASAVTVTKAAIALANGTNTMFVIGNYGAASCTVGTYTGLAGGNANAAINWCAGNIPTSTTNVIISNGAPVLTNNLSVNNLTLAAGINLNGYTLTVNGSYVGSGNITGSPTSSLVLAGPTNATLSFDQTTPATTNTLNNLTLNTTAAITLANALNIKGTLNPGASTFNTGGNLTLLSDSNGTARVAQVLGTINGYATVQRYIPAKASRKYSFIGSSIATSIRNSWQQQIYISGAGNGGTTCGTTNGNGGIGSGSYNPGSIDSAGNVIGDSVVATDKYNTNGFDVTPSNNPSMFTYQANPVNNSSWVSVSNTDRTSLVPGLGYKLNIRGDRNSSTTSCANQLNSANPSAPEAVTLKATGTITTGNVTVALNDTSLQKFTLVANPYPSQISFSALQAANAAINNKMWTFSPYGNGNYTTYSAGVIANAAAGYDNTSGDYLASGQAFFVEANKNGSLGFQESIKIASAIPNTQYFGITSSKLLRIGLTTTDNKSLDEVVLRFNESGTKQYNPTWDAISMNAASQVLTVVKQAKGLAIATYPQSNADTAQLGISTKATGTYRLLGKDFAGIDNAVSILLRDKFLHTTQDIRANQVYDFNVTTDSASQGVNRFEVIFTGTANVNFTNVSATENKGAVAVAWKVTNEQSVANYVIESSIDNSNFTQIAQTKATGVGNYTLQVEIPATNTTYYRIKAIGIDGTIAFSNTTLLTTNHSPLTTISVYPNPVQSHLNITLAKNSTTTYKLRILTITGIEALNKAEVTANNSTITLPVSNLAAGVYSIELTDAQGNKQLKKFVKE